MRSVIGMGTVAVLVLGPSVAAEVVHAPSSGIRMSAGDPVPAALKNRTTLQVLPHRPHQSDTVRVFVHCPPAANQAIIGSTAFRLKGSRRPYREVGLGLSGRGLGRRSVSISYFAILGDHVVRMKCVKVTINRKTRHRKLRVVSRRSVPLEVRRFRFARYFD